MSSLISSIAWFALLHHPLTQLLTHSYTFFDRVKRGIAAHHPSKYVLDDKELERVSALARIELEDARVELARAHEAAKGMGRGAEGDEGDDAADDDNGDADAWVE
jgi:periodic tryptophan protein 1